jgi:tagatose 1,6-diphosphate aldolase
MAAGDRRTLSPGKMRGLAAASTRGGVFCILALDHRDSLRVMIDGESPAAVPARTLTDLKLELLRELAPEATAVMVDPEYSAAQAIVTRSLPGSVGFLVALEAQGYLGDPRARQTSLLDGWSVEKANRLGASGIKLLVLYRPDAGEITEVQDRMISAVISDCARFDVPLFLEPLAYLRESEMASDPAGVAAQRRSIVVETVRRLGAFGPDVLKVQFPLDARHEPDRATWADACAELDEAAPVPWALLSGGEPYELFLEQVSIACAAGASGFMVGRALWREVVTARPEDRSPIIEHTMRPRLRELARVAGDQGRDWAMSFEPATIDESWYLTY